MDFDLMCKSIPQILGGARLTVLLVSLSLSMGFCLAIIVALLRRANIPLISAAIEVYVFVIRGTPLLVQLFLIYYGLGQFRSSVKAFCGSF